MKLSIDVILSSVKRLTYLWSAITNTLIALVVCLTIAIPSAKATPILDQEFVPVTPNGFATFTELTRVQTFTVGQAGLLSRVEVALETATGYGAFERTFQIITTDPAGVPVYGTTPLATFTITLPAESLSGYGFYGADLTSFNLMVNPGDVLGIVDVGAEAPDNGHWWVGTYIGPETYADGMFYTEFFAGGVPDGIFHSQDNVEIGIAYDMGFKTYIDDGYTSVPEPATMLLLGLGIVGLVGVRRKFQI